MIEEREHATEPRGDGVQDGEREQSHAHRRLPRDAETGRTTDGRSELRFRVMTTREWTSRTGDRHQAAEWHNVRYSDRPGRPTTAELYPYGIQGKVVHVDGWITMRLGRGGNEETRRIVIEATSIRLIQDAGMPNLD